MILSLLLALQPFVTVELREQLGNQMFEVAAAYSLALENGAELLVPDLRKTKKWNIEKNYEDIFWRVKALPLPRKVRFVYEQKNMPFEPIRYTPDMQIKGLFFSEKYFKKHARSVCALFAPKQKIVSELKERYPEVFSHPLPVAVHIRTYERDDPAHQAYLFLGWDYFKEAMAEFPEEALFVICSENMDQAEKELAGFRPHMLFVRGQPHTYDLYLMSLCQHHILSNSTFSWWSAYLNPSREKIVIAPRRWYSEKLKVDQRDYYPMEWVIKEN